MKIQFITATASLFGFTSETRVPSVGVQLSEAMYVVAGIAAAMVGLVAIFYFGFRVTGNLDASSDANTRKRLVRSIRGLQIFIGFLLLALVSSILQMRGEPLLPNLTGLTVNLLWQAGLFSALRNQKARLRQLDTNGTLTVLSKNTTKIKGA